MSNFKNKKVLSALLSLSLVFEPMALAQNNPKTKSEQSLGNKIEVRGGYNSLDENEKILYDMILENIKNDNLNENKLEQGYFDHKFSQKIELENLKNFFKKNLFDGKNILASQKTIKILRNCMRHYYKGTLIFRGQV